MKKKQFLFDFSAGMACCAVISFTVLFYFFGYHWKNSGSAVFAVFFILACLGFLFLLYYFVFHAASLSEEGVRFGKLFIPRENLKVSALYDQRFRESEYLLRDTRTDYRSLSEKEAQKAQIRLEATRRNQKKLEAYTGLDLTPAKKPQRRRRRRF